MLMGVKSGYAKYPCFFCHFDSRNSEVDFCANHQWERRETFNLAPLISPSKIAFPVLHLKLGLCQVFIKNLDSECECFQYVRQKFRKSDAKLENGVLNGPEIRLILKDTEFINKMTSIEQNAWEAFRVVAFEVLSKSYSSCWQQKIDNLIECYKTLGVSRMTIKKAPFVQT